MMSQWKPGWLQSILWDLIEIPFFCLILVIPPKDFSNQTNTLQPENQRKNSERHFLFGKQLYCWFYFKWGRRTGFCSSHLKNSFDFNYFAEKKQLITKSKLINLEYDYSSHARKRRKKSWFWRFYLELGFRSIFWVLIVFNKVDEHT